MLIVAERINASRKAVRAAIEAQDAAAIQKALAQAEALCAIALPLTV